MADFRLDRYTGHDEPSARKRRLRQIDCDKIEEAFDSLTQRIADIEAAQATATAAAREAARINSYPNPASILTAADVGSDCTITIASHTRVYPVQGTIDVADLAVTGGTVTGLSFSTTYFIYYDDISLANATPTYLATTTAATAQVGAAAGRHFVGQIATPADGGGGTSGGGYTPPGGNGGLPYP